MAVSFMFVFMLVIGRQVRGRAATIAAYGVLAILIVGLLISGTRSAWVAFFIAVVVAIVRYGVWGRIVALVAVAVVALALLLSPSAASLVVDRTIGGVPRRGRSGSDRDLAGWPLDGGRSAHHGCRNRRTRAEVRINR